MEEVSRRARISCPDITPDRRAFLSGSGILPVRMDLRLTRGFGTGDIETIGLSPAVLMVEVAPEKSEDVEAVLRMHSVRGRFTCTAEPPGGRFLVAIDDSSDLDSLREALETAEGIDECGGLSGCRRDPYAVRDLVEELHRRREDALARKDLDTLEDEVALGLYGDEDW